VFHVTASHYFYKGNGATFHGRDIFAPVAAWLSKGIDSHKFGEQISDHIKISFPRPTVSGDNTVHGEIVSFDHFGNAVTNISVKDLNRSGQVELKHKIKVKFKDRDVPFVGHYAEADGQTLSATINGYGRLEFFLNQNHAARVCNISIGDPVNVIPLS
jgi:S-adenosylmethionine hydrolase